MKLIPLKPSTQAEFPVLRGLTAFLRLHRTMPAKVGWPPSGPLWGHENKHDGYRLMVRRDGERGRCFTRGGHDWAVAGNKYGCESLGGDWMMGTIMKRTELDGMSTDDL